MKIPRFFLTPLPRQETAPKVAPGWRSLAVAIAIVTLTACGGTPPADVAEGDPASPETLSAPAAVDETAPNDPAAPETSDPAKAGAADPADKAIAVPTPIQSNSATPAAGEQIAATIYTADQLCENLIPRQVDVNAQTPIEAVVGEVLSRQQIPQLDLEGYSVKLDRPTGVVTIDFEVAADSPRHLVSLSSCERFSLLGGLQETLTADDRWEITEVRFLEQGEEILL